MIKIPGMIKKKVAPATKDSSVVSGSTDKLAGVATLEEFDARRKRAHAHTGDRDIARQMSKQFAAAGVSRAQNRFQSDGVVSSVSIEHPSSGEVLTTDALMWFDNDRPRIALRNKHGNYQVISLSNFRDGEYLKLNFLVDEGSLPKEYRTAFGRLEAGEPVEEESNENSGASADTLAAQQKDVFEDQSLTPSSQSTAQNNSKVGVEPWEMTAEEWRSSKANAKQDHDIGRMLVLNFGIYDVAQDIMEAAITGRITISKRVSEDAHWRIHTVPTHYDVVHKALSMGLPVPERALSPYQELQNGAPSPADLQLSTPNACMRYVTGTSLFEISTPEGAKAYGYIGYSDDARQQSNDEQGEIVYVTVPENLREQGIGLSLLRDCSEVIKSKGLPVVACTANTGAGVGLVAKARQEGLLPSALEAHVPHVSAEKKNLSIAAPVTGETQINFSAIVRDKKGNPFFVNTKRHNKIDISSFEGGRPVINSDTSIVVDLVIEPNRLYFDNEFWENEKIVKHPSGTEPSQTPAVEQKKNRAESDSPSDTRDEAQAELRTPFEVEDPMLGKLTLTPVNNTKLPEGHRIIKQEIFRLRREIPQRLQELYDFHPHDDHYRISLIENSEGKLYGHCEYVAEVYANGKSLNLFFSELSIDALESVAQLKSVSNAVRELYQAEIDRQEMERLQGDLFANPGKDSISDFDADKEDLGRSSKKEIDRKEIFHLPMDSITEYTNHMNLESKTLKKVPMLDGTPYRIAGSSYSPAGNAVTLQGLAETTDERSAKYQHRGTQYREIPDLEAKLVFDLPPRISPDFKTTKSAWERRKASGMGLSLSQAFNDGAEEQWGRVGDIHFFKPSTWTDNVMVAIDSGLIELSTYSLEFLKQVTQSDVIMLSPEGTPVETDPVDTNTLNSEGDPWSDPNLITTDRLLEEEAMPQPTKAGDHYYYLATGKKGAYFTLRQTYFQRPIMGRVGNNVRDEYVANLGPNRDMAIEKALTLIPGESSLYGLQKTVAGKGDHSGPEIIKFGKKYQGMDIHLVSDHDPNFLWWLYHNGVLKKQSAQFQAIVQEIFDSHPEMQRRLQQRQERVEHEEKAAQVADTVRSENTQKTEWLQDALARVNTDFARAMYEKLENGASLETDFSPAMISGIRKCYAKLKSNRARVNSRIYKQFAQEFDNRMAESIGDRSKAERFNNDSVPEPTSREEVDAIARFTVYKSGGRYAIRGEGRYGMGDTLEATLDAANKRASFEKNQHDNHLKKIADEEAVQARNAENDREQIASFGGFLSEVPMQLQRQRKTLETRVRSNGKETTRKQLIEDRIEKGYVVTKYEVTNHAARKKAEDEVIRLARSAPTGNKMHPDTIRLRELQKRIKDDVFKVTERRLENAEGTGLDEKTITKIGMDYAEYLLGQKEKQEQEADQSAHASNTSAVKYLVLNENTLCYRAEGTTMLGALASNVDGRHWKNGPFHAGNLDNLRPATAEDFKQFRVKLPPDFVQQYGMHDADRLETNASDAETVESSIGESLEGKVDNAKDTQRDGIEPGNEQQASASSSNIDDFGEKIGGAKKDIWKTRGMAVKDLEDMTQREMTDYVKKQKVFPKPDYKALKEYFNLKMEAAVKIVKDRRKSEIADMVDMGASMSYLVKIIYDSIQNPRSGWDKEKYREYIRGLKLVQSYIESIETINDLTKGVLDKIFGNEIIEGSGYFRKINQKHENYLALSYLGPKFLKKVQISDRDVANAMKKVLDTGFPEKQEAWQRMFRIIPGNRFTVSEGYRYVDGTQIPVYSVNLYGHSISNHTEDKNAIEEQIAAARDKYFIAPHKRMMKLDLAAAFDSENDAREAARDLYQVTVNRKTNSRPIHKSLPIERTGKDYRMGEDVTTDQFLETFGWRGGEFGKWANQAERQASMNMAYDALMDLTEILGLPPKALSLNGELGIAFGARGSGHAAAHYECSRVVINLTKTMGAGSLAHEWAHALDDYFGRSSGARPYTTNRYSPFYSQGPFREDALRTEAKAAWETLMTTIEKKQESFTKHFDPEASKQTLEKNFSWLGERLDKIKKRILEDNSRYSKRYKPPTTGQIQALDDIIGKLLAGDMGELKSRPKSRYKTTTTRLDELHAISRQIQGRDNYDEQVGNALATISYHQHQLENPPEPQEINRTIFTRYAQAANALDGKKSEPYWSTRPEMFARAFESYVLDKIVHDEAVSDYLVHQYKLPNQEGVTLYRGEGERPYPWGEERTKINQCFDDLFDTLQHRETEKGIALFMRKIDSTGKNPLSLNEIRSTLAEIEARYDLDAAPPIQLVASVNDLPEDAQRRLLLEDGDENTCACLSDGILYLVQDQVETREMLEEAILHEWWGHFGEKALLGERVWGVHHKIHEHLGGEQGIIAYAKRHNLDMTPYLRVINNIPPEERSFLLVTELLANQQGKIAEELGHQKLARLLSELLGAIRDWLRRSGLVKLNTIGDSDLALLLKRNRHAAHGLPTDTPLIFDTLDTNTNKEYPHEWEVYDLPVSQHHSPASTDGMLTYSEPGSVPVERTQTEHGENRDNFFLHYKHIETGHLTAGVRTAKTEQEAAHIAAPIRKYAQENLFALVTDGNGNVLELIRFATGSANNLRINSTLLVAGIANVPNAESAWLLHNHTNYDARPSEDDISFTRCIERSLKGSGIDLKGHVIVAPGGRFSCHTHKDSKAANQKIPARPRNHRLPFSERVMRKHQRKYLEPITSSFVAKSMVKNLCTNTGLLLVNHQNQPVGVLALSDTEMGTLIKGEHIPRILHAIDSTNASGCLVVAETEKSARNIGNYLSVLSGFKHVDTILRQNGRFISAADTHMPLQNIGTFFKRTSEVDTAASPGKRPRI